MSSKLPALEDVERLSERVIRILALNPGKFTLQGTNTYLIGSGPKRILIDTGEGRPEWLSLLKKTLDSESATLDKVLITHWHPDHIGGAKDVLSLVPAPTIHKNSPIQNWSDITDGQRFTVPGATLRAFHSPGHTTDHMSFVLEEEDALFTGDNVLGHGTAVFEDLSTYIASLSRMADAVNGRGYPGHGAVLESSKARIGEYIAHRQQREREVVEALAREEAGGGGRGLGSMDLVKVIYKDTPESLHFAASRGVVQVLQKLEGEGKVLHDGEENTWTLKRQASL